MDIGIVASRYAKTLLRFAEENKEEDQVYKEMNTLAVAYQEVPALRPTLANPALTAQQQADILVTAATGRQMPTATTQKFLALVAQNRRATLMQFIATSFQRHYLHSKHIIRGSLTVPVAVGEKTTQKLQQLVEARAGGKVEFSVKIEPELGGGFVLQYDTYRLDASLRTQLNQLRRKLS